MRRVWWAANLYLHDKILSREWQLIIRANVNNLWYVPEVKCAIEAAIHKIEVQSLVNNQLSLSVASYS